MEVWNFVGIESWSKSFFHTRVCDRWRKSKSDMHICDHQIVSCKTSFFLSIRSFISSDCFNFKLKFKINLTTKNIERLEIKKGLHSNFTEALLHNSMFLRRQHILCNHYLVSTFCRFYNLHIIVFQCGTCFAVYTLHPHT